MEKYIVFDIETQNAFSDVNSNDPVDLDLSVIVIYDSQTDKYYSFSIDELDGLWPIIEKAETLIGFNNDHFDTPILNKYYHGDLFHFKSIDLLKSIKDSFGRRVKLDDVAKMTLNVQKSGHGLEAIMWWKNGEVEKIKKYCEDDVRITKELFDYALEHKSLKVKDFTGGVVEVPIDTSTWLAGLNNGVSPSVIPQSLPF